MISVSTRREPELESAPQGYGAWRQHMSVLGEKKGKLYPARDKKETHDSVLSRITLFVFFSLSFSLSCLSHDVRN